MTAAHSPDAAPICSVKMSRSSPDSVPEPDSSNNGLGAAARRQPAFVSATRSSSTTAARPRITSGPAFPSFLPTVKLTAKRTKLARSSRPTGSPV